jgi:hypothetical protein
METSEMAIKWTVIQTFRNEITASKNVHLYKIMAIKTNA